MVVPFWISQPAQVQRGPSSRYGCPHLSPRYWSEIVIGASVITRFVGMGSASWEAFICRKTGSGWRTFREPSSLKWYCNMGA